MPNKGNKGGTVIMDLSKAFIVVIVVTINLFNVDINITIKISYRKKRKKNTGLHENKANRCRVRTVTENQGANGDF